MESCFFVSFGMGELMGLGPVGSFAGLDESFPGKGTSVLGDCGAEDENLELRLDIHDPRLIRDGGDCLSLALFGVGGDDNVFGLSGLDRICICGL